MGAVHELIVNGVFAMDSVSTSTETALAELALAACEAPRRVLIGGLGLGHTALAVLRDPRVAEAVVAEIEAPLVQWASARLVPSLAEVASSPRVDLVAVDVAALLARSPAAFDAILLDVDNGPSFLVHAHNAGLYAESGLRAALAALAPGGVLAIWAAQAEPALVIRLDALAAQEDLDVREEVLAVAREGRTFEYAVYLAVRRSRSPAARPRDLA